MRKFRTSFYAGAAATAVLVSGQAAAQQAPALNAGAAEPQGGLEEIVVTARKRVENAQNVPVAVTAFTSATITKRDLSSLERFAAATPSLNIVRAASGSGAVMALRGIGSNSSSIGIESSIATVVDGAYYGQGRILNEGFFDLASVEILKGPQALFYGKNATAGVISIKTASPTDHFEMTARAGYEFKAKDLSGDLIVSGPLTDTLGIRVALKASQMYGGYFTNLAQPTTYTTTNLNTGTSTTWNNVPSDRDAGQIHERIGRVTLEWKPTDQLTTSVKISGNINNNNNPAYNYVLVNCPSGSSALNAAVPCGRGFNIYTSNFPTGIGNVTYLGGNGDLRNEYSSWQITHNLEYRGEHVTLTSVANYNWNKNHYVCDCDFTVSNLRSSWGTEEARWHAFSWEGRALTSYDGPINAMIGMLYQKTRRKYDSSAIGAGRDNPNVPAFAEYLTNIKNSATNGETIAVFGQVIWKLIPNLELTSGVRYTHETKDSYFRHDYVNPLSITFDGTRTVTANQKFDNWSPEATLTYRPTENVTLYGGYRTAYKSGGFSNSGILSPAGTVNDFAFNPETVKGFEGGIKTMLFDRQLRANLALYSYIYSNVQIDFFNSSIFAFTTFNAGTAKTRGAELDLEFAPRAVPGLTLRGSLNYNKANYGTFTKAPCYAGQSIAQGCTIGATRPEQDLSGVPTADAPKWAGAAGIAYDTALTDSFNLGLSVDTRYSASYLASPFGNKAAGQDSYVTLDAGIRLETADKHWEVALIGKNLTNRFYINGVFDGPLTGRGTGTPGGVLADQAGFAAMPRTVQLKVTWHY